MQSSQLASVRRRPPRNIQQNARGELAAVEGIFAAVALSVVMWSVAIVLLKFVIG